MKQRPTSIPLIALLILTTTSCSERLENSAAYKAACEGPPVHGVEAREKAMVEGYSINNTFDCIDKRSFAAVAEQKAQWEAAHTPEAIARQKAEFAQQKVRDEEQRQQREAEAEERARKEAEAVPAVVLHPTDVNTATEADIARVISVGPEVAAQIIAERNKRRFTDWADLVHRVVGLSAAQTAFYASVCNLTVNGKSHDGAAPNAVMAAGIQKQYSRYR